MKYNSMIAALLLCVVGPGFGGELPSPDQAILLQRAQKTAKATMEQDAETVVSMTHSSIAMLIPPTEKLLNITKNSMAQMRQMGLTVEKFDIGQPTETYEASNKLICFVPYVANMKLGSKTGRSIGYLVAIRDTPRSQWMFLDSAIFRKSPELLKAMLPGLPKGVPSLPNENQFDN